MRASAAMLLLPGLCAAAGAAAQRPDLQTGSVEVRAALVLDGGARSAPVHLHLQREMPLPNCRKLLASAPKVENPDFRQIMENRDDLNTPQVSCVPAYVQRRPRASRSIPLQLR